jgi:hypothetical protein
MSKKMQVVVVFEFDEVDDIESDKADEIIQRITKDTENIFAWRGHHGADRVWVEAVFRNSEKWVLAEEV